MVETLTANYSWTKPDPGHSATTWGTFLNADLDSIDAHMWTINTQVQLNALSVQRGADGGANGAVYFNNNGGSQSRWILYETSESESGGGNAGSNFALGAYSNTGAWLGAAFTVARATQNVTFGQSVTVPGNLSVGGNLSAGALSVSGTFTANNITVSNQLTTNSAVVNGTLTASNATINNSLNTVGLSATNTQFANLYVTNAASFEGYYAGTQFQLGANSGLRWLQFSSSWSLFWRNSDGLLYWSTPGGPGGTEWNPFQVDVAGNIMYAGSLVHISDAAAKENIAPFEGDPLAIVAGIPVKLYNLLGKPERQIGFIAQDVQAVMPEAVMPTKDDVLGVDQNRLVAVLWKAVQNLSARVQELEAR